MQLPLFQPEIDWTPTQLSELPSWRGAGRIAVDCETRDEQLTTLGPGVRRGGYMVGISFAIEDGPSHYIPFAHQGGGNICTPEQAFAYMRDQATDFTGDLCGANIQYDLDYMAEQKIVFRNVRYVRDCQVAEPLLDELQFKYNLDAIAARRGIPGKKEELLKEMARVTGVDPKKELWKLPGNYVADYAIQDVELPLQLLRRQEREIDEQDLWNVWNLESDVLPVLVKMRRRGVKIDFDQLERVEKWALQQETESLEKLFHLTGVRVAVGDVWKPEELARSLQAVGAVVPRTSSGQFSIDQELLASLHHPAVATIQRARKVNKLRTTFAKSVRTHAVGDRIHCTFNQLRKTDDGSGKDGGARYGRVSCCDPNLQQQPKRDDFAKMWRSIYIPDSPDAEWCCNDYSQQEPRWQVHFAELCHNTPKVKFHCPSAVTAAEAYRNDPNTDSHTMMARIVYSLLADQDPTTQQRDVSKIIYLGQCYGMGGGKLATDLGLPTKMIVSRRTGRPLKIAGDEAQAIIDLFNRKAPFVKAMSIRCEAKAKREGYIKTVSGRRCRFPEISPGNFDWTYRALNRLIQGSAGDQTKMAMVAVDKAGHYIQLQVHDELDGSIERREQGHEIGTIMREVIKANVPFKVDTEIGPSWGQAA